MKITIEIPDQHMIDALRGAYSGYWCKYGAANWPNLAFCVTELEDTKERLPMGTYRVNRSRIAKAFNRMAIDYPTIFARFMAQNNDGNDNDILLQLACFNEVKYG